MRNPTLCLLFILPILVVTAQIATGSSFSIQLIEGLNLISLPLIPNDCSSCQFIPQNTLFPHIKTYASIYSSLNASQKNWSATHFDMSTPGQKVTNISLVYVSWSDLDRASTVYYEVYDKFNINGQDFDDAFYHYEKDVTYPLWGSSPDTVLSQRKTSQKEDKVYKLFVGDSASWQSGSNCRYGSCLKFDGVNDYVSISGNRSLEPNAITIEAWIKPNGTYGRLNTIVAYSSSESKGYHLAWDNRTRNIIWWEVDNGTTPPFNLLGATANLMNGQWYHIVATYNTSVMYVYINGVLVGTRTPTVTNPEAGYDTSDVFIGGNWGSFYFNGTIDEVRIYNRTLSQSEIAQRYVNNTNITDGLIGYWHFNEGSDDIVADSSGNGNNGAIAYSDKTNDAYGDIYTRSFPQAYNVSFCSNAGETLYIGHIWKFKEINFNLVKSADNSWNGIWEYWNGTIWRNLSVNDGTLNMTQSGKIEFFPPTDWNKTTINDIKLYWIKLRCITTGTSTPIAQSVEQVIGPYEWEGTSAISGQKYEIRNNDTVVFPGWNQSNDRNGDGFVDDSEFSNLTDPNATARFKYLARVPSWYLTNRWVMNLNNSIYVEYIANSSYQTMISSGVDGIFVDNSNCVLSDPFWGYKKYIEYSNVSSEYLADSVNSIRVIKQRHGNRPVIINNPSISCNDLVDVADGKMYENLISYRNSYLETQSYLTNFWNTVKNLCEKNKALIVHGDQNLQYGAPPDLPTERYNLYVLARYYLTASNCTYFKYQNSSNYARPWDDWFDAIGYNIGQPTSDFYMFSMGRTNYPDPPPENILKNPSFEVDDDNNSMPDNWSCGNWIGKVQCSINGTSKNGSYSMRVNATLGINYGGAFQYVTLTQYTNYTLSGWIKTENLQSTSSTAAVLYIYCGPGGCNGTRSIGISAGTQNWTFVSTTVTTWSNISGAYVYAGQIVNGNGTAWFDDITLEEGNYPLYHIFARNFTNATVLLKPMPTATSSYGNSTAITIDLNSMYYPLYANGSLGQPTNQTSLRNFEGMILVKIV